MAKSLLSIRTKKKPKVTRSEAYMVNLKYLGDEPDPKKFKTNSDYIKALTWYGSMCTVSDARQYLKDYFVHNKEMGYAKKVDKIPDNWVPLTAAWQSRIVMNQKASFDLDDYVKFISRVDEAVSHVREEKTEDRPKVDKPSIQDRVRERGYDIVGEVEAMIDSGEPFSLYDWLKKNEIPAMYAARIAEYYEPWLMELHEALGGDDPQLKEAYSHLTKKGLRERVVFFETLVGDARRYGSVEKKKRAVRKPKPVSVEKQIRGLKFQRESAEYRLASVDPSTILGAQELWTFNTKYKTVTVFRALDRGGLRVKGTSIVGYDEKASASYKTGRKPAEVAEELARSTKAGVKKLLQGLKPNPFNARLSENAVLVKVIKQ